MDEGKREALGRPCQLRPKRDLSLENQLPFVRGEFDGDCGVEALENPKKRRSL